MKTILIPTDFSENAAHAVKYALELYKCERSQFYFLHAYADKVYEPFRSNTKIDIEAENKKVKKETDKRLNTLINKVADIPPNPKHTYESVSVFDSLVNAVNDFVNKINIDIIIMGTKGKTKDKKLPFGSHTVEVFKYVQCPVLAIPEDIAFRQPKKIVFPTDYMLPYKRRELKLLNSLSAQYKSEIYCLYISNYETLSSRQKDNKRFLSESLPDAYLFFELTAEQNKSEAIKKYIKHKSIDFLVMVNSRHSYLENLLYRSTVDKIGLTTKIPFLVMQNLPR